MGRYFGLDGFRGEANVTLTADHAFKIGRFLGWYYCKLRRRSGMEGPARVVIGKDTRRSSYMLEANLIGGLVASGADAYLLHVVPIPAVSYIVRTDGFDCGIMVSASHNPYYDNGIKLFAGTGEKMDDETLSMLEDYLDGKLNAFGRDWQELPLAQRNRIGRSVDYVAGRNRYIGYLISLGRFSFQDVKVGLDCANGSSWITAKAVFDALGAKTFVINADPNGYNINENSGSSHIEILQRFVLENHLDVGFAFDGDSDRCLCVDERGGIVTGDHILYICGCYMKEHGMLRNNTVVTTVMSNAGLYRALDELDIQYARTQVGDRYVYEYMRSHSCSLGGEQNGHILFSKYGTSGDGILTSLKIMEIMMDTGKPLSKLHENFNFHPQITRSIRVSDKEKAANDPEVQELVSQIADSLKDTGRILVRASGTEPVVRVMVEAPREALCEEYISRILCKIRENGHQSF